MAAGIDRKEVKVLVVDDTASNRVLLRSLLASSGFQVDVCESGEDCLAYCEGTPPHMILLDILMPGLDGIEVCSSLRQRFSKSALPIIMVTARSEGEDLAAALDAGANDYVVKPVDRAVLMARIENQLSVVRYERELDDQRRSVARTLEIQRALGDVLPDSIVVHDPDGKVVYANRQLELFCGGAIPGTISEVFASLFEGGLEQWCLSKTEVIKSNPVVEFSHEMELGARRVRVLRVLSRPVEVGPDTVFRLWLWSDVTRMRELERKINQQVRLETVGLFASGVAHNFNNFMGSILGATEVLRRVVGDHQRGGKCLDLIQKAVASSRKLTERMVTITHTRRDDQVDVTDFKDLLEEVVSVQGERFKDQVSFSIAEIPSGVALRMSEQAVSDVLNNVLENAAEAVASGGTVQVSGSLDQSRGLLKLSVNDTGEGMSRSVLEKAFEPFFSTKSLDEVNGVSIEGRGLGLWNVHNLLHLHEGTIDLKSTPGEGTQVTLQFPLAGGGS